VNLRERLARLCPAGAPSSSPRFPPLFPEREPLFGGGGESARGFAVFRTVFPLDHCHGEIVLREVAALDLCSLGALGDAAPRASSAGAPVFFDIETTSVGTGASVYAFIVGFARAGGDGLSIEQLYLEDPAGEREMLRAAAERIRAAPLIASFSGRGFDERRLEDRFRLHRLPSPFERGAHADLAPLARALWRSRLGSCTLAAIERARLGFSRDGDIPGPDCPAAYFRALRGDEQARKAVLRHNLLDLLSTAALAAALDRRRRGACDPPERLGLARYDRRRGRAGAALAALEAVARDEVALTREERRLLRFELWAALRRAGRAEEAAAHLRALCEGPGDPPLDALVELAKDAEHRARDLALAERCTLEALSLVRRRAVDLGSERRARIEAGLERRLARIEAKARRAAFSGAPRGP
jgi:uncharacterized protein YprB with RNaseH-like and TPR domain